MVSMTTLDRSEQHPFPTRTPTNELAMKVTVRAAVGLGTALLAACALVGGIDGDYRLHAAGGSGGNDAGSGGTPTGQGGNHAGGEQSTSNGGTGGTTTGQGAAGAGGQAAGGQAAGGQAAGGQGAGG